jgi:hypothetical protein
MIIRTNLYADVLEQQHRKKFSPTRIAITAVLAVVFLALFGYGKLLLSVRSLRKQVAATVAKEQATHQSLLNARTTAEVLKTKTQLREGFLGIAHNRINWAPILEKILSTLPQNVQLFGLNLAKHGNGEAAVTLEGRISGEQPRLECDKLRVLMLDGFREVSPSVSARFVHLDDLPEPVHKAGWTEPAAKFTIQITWTWKGVPNAK